MPGEVGGEAAQLGDRLTDGGETGADVARGHDVVPPDDRDVVDPQLVEHLLQQVYGGEGGETVPREVLVPVLPPDADGVSAWLGERRGSAVSLRVPQRGDKRELAATVAKNAEHALARHKVSRASDLTARSQALEELQENLGLPEAPLRIECFDISHVQGTNVVGSMVVFEDGLPRKSEYRRFIVNGIEGEDGTLRNDDVAAMHEVLTRRFQRHLNDREREATDPETGEARRFAYPPNLVVVDMARRRTAIVERRGRHPARRRETGGGQR